MSFEDRCAAVAANVFPDHPCASEHVACFEADLQICAVEAEELMTSTYSMPTCAEVCGAAGMSCNMGHEADSNCDCDSAMTIIGEFGCHINFASIDGVRDHFHCQCVDSQGQATATTEEHTTEGHRTSGRVSSTEPASSGVTTLATTHPGATDHVAHITTDP